MEAGGEVRCVMHGRIDHGIFGFVTTVVEVLRTFLLVSSDAARGAGCHYDVWHREKADDHAVCALHDRYDV